jgi:hypothetical protein
MLLSKSKGPPFPCVHSQSCITKHYSFVLLPNVYILKFIPQKYFLCKLMYAQTLFEKNLFPQPKIDETIFQKFCTSSSPLGINQGRRVNARAHGDVAERHGAAVRWAAHSTWHCFVPGLLPYAGPDLAARYPVATIEWRGHLLPGWSVNQLRDPSLTQRGDQGSS